MAQTPEGKVKGLTTKVLEKHKIYNASKAVNFPEDALGWFYYTTQTGFGVAGLPDLVGTYRGFMFGLELKAPGRRGQKFRGCSPHQHYQLNAIDFVGGYAAVVDGEEDLTDFISWLKGVDECTTTK